MNVQHNGISSTKERTGKDGKINFQNAFLESSQGNEVVLSSLALGFVGPKVLNHSHQILRPRLVGISKEIRVAMLLGQVGMRSRREKVLVVLVDARQLDGRQEPLSGAVETTVSQCLVRVGILQGQMIARYFGPLGSKIGQLSGPFGMVVPGREVELVLKGAMEFPTIKGIVFLLAVKEEDIFFEWKTDCPSGSEPKRNCVC